jgi:hypothetical protein
MCHIRSKLDSTSAFESVGAGKRLEGVPESTRTNFVFSCRMALNRLSPCVLCCVDNIFAVCLYWT